MGYFYTDHFLARIKERNISIDEVHQSLQDPESRYINNSKAHVFESNNIRVITQKRKQHFILLTAYTI